MFHPKSESLAVHLIASMTTESIGMRCGKTHESTLVGRLTTKGGGHLKAS